MTSEPERVPEALKAGCDGVLMKPFPPNLLYARIGRLLRMRAKELQDRAMWQRAKSTFLIEHAHHVMAGTNVVCHDAVCPACGQGDGVSFDAASHRRMWYACLPCGKVWMAPRHDGAEKRLASRRPRRAAAPSAAAADDGPVATSCHDAADL